MRRLLTPIFGACLILGGVNASAGQDAGTPGGNERCAALPVGAFRALTPAELDTLMRDVAASDPKSIEAMRQNPDLKRAHLNDLRRLLAVASQAEKEGLSNDPVKCRELEYVRAETIAIAYEKEINKGKPPITPARISAYWSKDLPGNAAAEREAAFQRFIETKIAVMGIHNPGVKDRPITEEAIEMGRELFATYQILLSDYEKRSASLPKSVRDGIDLKVKLQRAQFLARLYLYANAGKTSATEGEIAAFIAKRPELKGETKRSNAEQILLRAKNGEDFAKLANEFTQDPGNRDQNGVQQGGLYQGVRRGMMVEAFEKAALAVEAGQVYPTVVESDFGYHIVKLEKKDPNPAGTYDVRHILIATTIPDPNDPGGRALPVKQYAGSLVESEKRDRLMAEIVAANSISVPADFSLPTAAPKAAAKRPVRKAPVRRTRKRK